MRIYYYGPWKIYFKKPRHTKDSAARNSPVRQYLKKRPFAVKIKRLLNISVCFFFFFLVHFWQLVFFFFFYEYTVVFWLGGGEQNFHFLALLLKKKFVEKKQHLEIGFSV